MRGRQRTRSSEASVDLTPMLDVVFILLIFFIVTSTFLREEAIGLEPPPAGGSGEAMPVILISVDAENLIRVNQRLTDLSGVGAQIERLRAEDPERGLMIQAHSAARSGTVIKLRDIAYTANMERVNIIRTE